MKKKHEEYLYSPYKINGVSEKMYMTKSDETLTINPETGEYYTMRKVGQNKNILHDELIYTKLFQSGVNSIMDMSHSSLKILLYAMSIVRPLSEIVVLHSSDVCEACKIAEKTFYNNLLELLDKKILSRKMGSSIEFWFDPNIFFNGNRINVSRYRLSSLKNDLNLGNEVRNP
jgi:hypothetical protein